MLLRRIGPRVWQGDEKAARRLCEAGNEEWRRTGFRAVLCPAFNVRVPYHEGLAALVLPVRDDTDVDGAVYDLAVDFHRTFGATLVHCHGGLNRSSAFAAALLVAEGAPLEYAVGLVNARPCERILASLERWAKGRRGP